MASFNFSIRKNPKGTAKIILIFNYGRKKRYRYPTKFNLTHHKHWDKRNKRVKSLKSIPEHQYMNEELGKLYNHVENIVHKYANREDELSNDTIKDEINKLYQTKKAKDNKPKHQGLIRYFDWFIDYYSDHPRPLTNKIYKKETLKGIRSARNKLKELQDKIGYIEFDDVDLELHSQLFGYLYHENGYTLNYTGAIIKNLKTIMNDAYERGFHKNLDFKKAGFNVTKEDVKNVYLYETEIEKIRQLDLNTIDLDVKNHPEIFINKNDTNPTKDGLDRVRDWLIIGCNLGLRYGNLSSLTKANIEETYDKINDETFKAIKIKISKVDRIVLIPIAPQVDKILEKHDGHFPKKISSQKFNKYVKLICKEAGIIEKFEGHPKYLKVSSHTCRRTFCTNAYKNGMDTLDIMNISGHTSEKTFYNYIKATPRDRLNKIRNHKFFRS